MARITIEDCLEHVENRFALVNMVIKRVKQLKEGAEPLVNAPDNKEIVIALREIAAGKVLPTYNEDESEDKKESLDSEKDKEIKRIEIDKEEISSEFKEMYEKKDLTEHEEIDVEEDTYHDEEET